MSARLAPGRSASLAALALGFLAVASACVGPASAQDSGNVIARLQSLPPQAVQRNALQRYLYFYERRAFPNQRIPSGAMERARAQHEAQFGPIRPPQAPDANFNQNQWTPIGPAPAGGSSGRINSIAIQPSNPSVIYIGAATGGVWKTTNGGASWTALTDTQCSTAMGSVAIDPSNFQTIYAGTGEANFSADSYYGCGVLKSTDGGATWTQLGAGIFDTATGGATISKVLINPSAAQTVFVASSFGLYRSTNGGTSFSQVLSQTPVTDLVMDPTNSNILYAGVGNVFGNAGNGVYKSTDGGTTWSKLGGGFPTSSVGRISVAIAPSAPATLFAAVQNSSTSSLLGLYRSTDSGSTWSAMAATGASCAAQCWYDMYVVVDPTNANTVYFGGLSLYRSADGGGSFTDIGTSIHVDHHGFAFHPGVATTIYAGSDGGIYKSTDSGSSWTNLNADLSITQFYSGLSIHPTNPSVALGGTQDNHTVRYSGSVSWDAVTFSGVGGCDGGFTVIDQVTPTTQYAECQWQAGAFYSGPRRSDGGSFVVKTTGITTSDTALFIPPIIGSPTSATTLYFGTTRVYKTVDRADNWTASTTTLGGRVTTIAEAPSNANVVYAGASNGIVYKSADGNVTYTAASTGLPARTPTYVVVHPTDANTAFATFSGFGSGHVYKTTNGGASWSSISGNLPDSPANAIVLDPAAPTTEIFVGTDLGVYRTHDGGATWTVFNTGLPNVPVLDLKYNPATGLLVAATHGRGVFKATLNTSASTATHDFNGDGKSDILWRQSNSTVAMWLMNGASVSQASGVGGASADWQIVGQRDFNGDGKHDILWRNSSSGQVLLWLMNGATVTQAAGVGGATTDWQIVGTGDFNGDGKGDILWRHSGGQVILWVMNGATVTQAAGVGGATTDWQVAGVGDLNGDGKADILWRHSGGAVVAWLMNGASVTQAGTVGGATTDWQIVGTGDFNGDGKADILWRHSSGAVAAWLLNGVSVSQSGGVGSATSDWTIAETGDLNGDGKSDIIWR
ncbi:MAG: FG-GAP repeat protein, partial [Hyphomicrobiales bacterium]|nr:FG-GAP repeat protein [Hyphomicrobiales bacterium]